VIRGFLRQNSCRIGRLGEEMLDAGLDMRNTVNSICGVWGWQGVSFSVRIKRLRRSYDNG
jgi:hypothetical protein